APAPLRLSRHLREQSEKNPMWAVPSATAQSEWPPTGGTGDQPTPVVAASTVRPPNTRRAQTSVSPAGPRAARHGGEGGGGGGGRRRRVRLVQPRARAREPDARPLGPPAAPSR